ncbi:hypothetical protein HC766_08110 [Candidatus Gracilibacteria bacterium]|nr:hypothetical protein [Candidatus Gracilibacteria bacterium]
MKKDYRKDLKYLYFDIFRCLLRMKQPIRVSIKGILALALGEAQTFLKFLPKPDDSKTIFRIEFEERVKLFILEELQYSDLGVEIFGRAVGSNEQFLSGFFKKIPEYRNE